MKRILAWMLSLILLLSCCAFAEEAAPAAHSYRLSDIVFTYGDSTIDLSNIELCMDMSPDGEAALIHIDADGETAAELGFAKIDNLYAAHLAGELTGHKDFVSDPVVQLAKTLQGGIDGIVEMLQGVDTHALAENIMNFASQLEAAQEAEAEATPEPTEEPAEAAEGEDETLYISLTDLSFEGDIAALLEGCVTEVEDAEMDGSNGIPAGTYEATIFFADEQTVADALNMVYMNDEPLNLGDMMLESGLELGIGVVLYHNDEADASDVSLAFEIEDESYNANLIGVHTGDENGKTGTYAITCDQNGQVMSIGFTTYDGVSTDKTFGPDSIDLASAINVDELSDEEASSTIIEAFQSLLGDAMLPVLAPVINAAAEGGDLAVLFNSMAGAMEEVPMADAELADVEAEAEVAAEEVPEA